MPLTTKKTSNFTKRDSGLLYYGITLKLVRFIIIKFSLFLSICLKVALMTILFYFVVAPIGLIRHLLRQESLDLRIDKNIKSYWLSRAGVKSKKNDYEKMF